MIQNEANERQIEAADPTRNTWLSANAGSGKTRVLTDRVARLLLSGVSPQNILCLTYTKAAASEMQNRLFARLGEWAMKPESDLRSQLSELGVKDFDDLARARRLFAGAIETPGGLKIQTIHSFCAAILRRFPLEAGIAPLFQEIDDRSAKVLQAEVLDDMAAGALSPVVRDVAAFFTDSDFADFIEEVANRRDAFVAQVPQEEIWNWFDLSPDFNEAALEASALAPGDGALLAEFVSILAAGKTTDKRIAEKLKPFTSRAPSWRDLAVLENVFLTGPKANIPFSAKIGSVPTADLRKGPAAHLMPDLEDLMSRIEAARPLRIALDSARKTLALHRFAHPFVTEYEKRKRARGWLDFDDLITLAGRLLNDPGLAAWVLYRLDGGIDHILVDEAQDTSPAQWRVIESLAREFTSGESARSDLARTLFVVGDVKQSIYSFQGADPAEFARMHEKFAKAFEQIGQTVKPLELEYSFRSSRAILDVVDFCLDAAPGLGAEVKHIAFQNERPGRVDLWPVIEKADKPEPRPWTDPVDMLAPEDSSVILANQIASAISDMLKTGSIPSKNGGMRRIEPGDVMVLVRRRSSLFHQVIRACKALGLPIAGADVLRIGGELAVKDITAVLAFLATPEDDLSLAAVLRSPLCGLDENALFHLAHGREGRYLWNTLRERAEMHHDVIAMLDDLRNEADFLRPYDLIERILTRHDGRRRLVARLGPEAEDGIDALLAQALTYERIQVPSLTGFLNWLATEDVQVKRQMDDAGNQIRVMTVHGAKGLEAPVVFLPDTAVTRKHERRKTIDANGNALWRAPRDLAPETMREALDTAKDHDWEENMRLLYVAMTRAESWLIVAGAGDVGKQGEGQSWYRIVEAGLQKATATRHQFSGGDGLRYESGAWNAEIGRAIAEAAAPTDDIPAWMTTVPTMPDTPPAPLVPSSLGGAKVIGKAESAAQEQALRHGRQVHRLLEFLPSYSPKTWAETTRALLAFGEDSASASEAEALLAEVQPILLSQDLAHLFTEETLAEIELSAPINIAGANRIHGIVDRLVIRPDHVLAVDFKTNREVPARAEDIPEGILRQMGAYESALSVVYPDRTIETAILWTRTAKLMPLPPGLALRAFGRLDVPRAPT